MQGYLSVLILFVIALVFSGIFIGLSYLLGPKKPNPSKLSPYECGMPPIGSPRERFHVKFFLVAIIFILFDVEAVFLYPWAVLLKFFKESGQGVFVLVEMLVFMFVLGFGLYYVWKRRALDWEEK